MNTEVVAFYAEEFEKLTGCEWEKEIISCKEHGPEIVKEAPPRRDEARLFARMWWLAGMTQRQIGRKLGVSEESVRRYMRGSL